MSHPEIIDTPEAAEARRAGRSAVVKSVALQLGLDVSSLPQDAGVFLTLEDRQPLAWLNVKFFEGRRVIIRKLSGEVDYDSDAAAPEALGRLYPMEINRATFDQYHAAGAPLREA